jgi:hypothetical protein
MSLSPSRIIYCVIGLGALYFFEVPQRIDWQATKDWRNIDALSLLWEGFAKYSKTRSEQASQDFRLSVAQAVPGQPKPTPSPKQTFSPLGLLAQQICLKETIQSQNRISQGQYLAHLEARDLGVDSPIRRVPPYCKTKTGGDLFIPDWLDDYVLRIEAASRDDVIKLQPADKPDRPGG